MKGRSRTRGAAAHRIARVLAVGWLTHLKERSSSSYFMVVTAFESAVFACVAGYLFQAGSRPDSLLYAAIGAGLVGVWHSTLVGSGQALTMSRQEGVLELLVLAPTPVVCVLAPITLVSATIGLYSMAASLAVGWLLFDIPLHVAHPSLLLVAVPVAVLGFGLMGVVLASVFVLYRHANALTTMFQFPTVLAAGLLVPVGLLPGWVQPISAVLTPTWAARAIRESVLGGRPVVAIGVCLALGAGYLALGVLSLRFFERQARRQARLALA